MTKKASLVSYTLSHLCVDFACFYLLFRCFLPFAHGDTLAAGFLIYNILAFGLQPLIGAYCDGHPRLRVSLIGCLLLLGALCISAIPWTALIISALGNACFHVGGGIDSLVQADGKLARSGVFVSSGALGVPLGTLAGKAALSVLLPIALVLLSMLLLFLLAPPVSASKAAFRCSAAQLGFGAALGLCAVSVMIRSYGGMIIPMPWKTAGGIFLLILPGLSAMLGKASGGFLADRFGARRIGVAALVLSLPLLCFGSTVPPLSALGLAFFNMTMPVSLGALAARLPHSPGLAFGISTLALLVGCAPTFYFTLPDASIPYAFAALTAASALCLALSTSNEH